MHQIVVIDALSLQTTSWTFMTSYVDVKSYKVSEPIH